MTKKFQVIVVGGGPVGVGLAVELGQRGIRCALVERRLEPQRIPKGQNITQRTLEHCYFWRGVNELRAARSLHTRLVAAVVAAVAAFEAAAVNTANTVFGVVGVFGGFGTVGAAVGAAPPGPDPKAPL